MTMSNNHRDDKEEFKRFYNSSKWQKCRRLVLERDNFVCVLCGEQVAEEVHHICKLTRDNIDNPNITLNPDNLISLCKSCHNLQHERFNKEATKRGTGKRLSATVEGLTFDSNGELVQVQSEVEDDDTIIESGDNDIQDSEN